MTYDSEVLKELITEFPELQDEEIILSKEVLAHFGLLFSAFALLEAGLQNCYIYWHLRSALENKSIRSQTDWNRLSSDLEVTAFGKTFGGLLTLLQECPEISPRLEELRSLGKSRNYFAHHFFRDENDKMFDNQAKLHLISRMNLLRKRVKEAESAIELTSIDLLKRLYPDIDVVSEINKVISEHKKALKDTPPSNFGWE